MQNGEFFFFNVYRNLDQKERVEIFLKGWEKMALVGERAKTVKLGDVG